MYYLNSRRHPVIGDNKQQSENNQSPFQPVRATNILFCVSIDPVHVKCIREWSFFVFINDPHMGIALNISMRSQYKRRMRMTLFKAVNYMARVDSSSTHSLRSIFLCSFFFLSFSDVLFKIILQIFGLN